MPKTKFLGKVLENCKTLAESGIHIGGLPEGVITMHVVVQPPVAKKKTCLYSFSIFFTSIKYWHIIYEVKLGSKNLPEELYFFIISYEPEISYLIKNLQFIIYYEHKVS
ncbi:hypothetical protein LguiB_009413 [Lonicera macranthoides]